MSSIARAETPTSVPLARLAPPLVASLAIAWNLFGLTRLVETVQSTPASLVRMGMSPAQAALYASVPGWMNAGFAVGVLGGLLGSLLLLARRRLAVPVLAASLAGYVVLFAGDVTEGVFAALGLPQVLVLTTVLAIATGLLAWSRRLARAGALR